MEPKVRLVLILLCVMFLVDGLKTLPQFSLQPVPILYLVAVGFGIPALILLVLKKKEGAVLLVVTCVATLIADILG